VAISYLRIQLIQSLQSPSYCSNFYDTVETAQLCSKKYFDPTDVRGATMLNASMALPLPNIYNIDSGCSSATQVASYYPQLALMNWDNYNVRI